MEWRQGCSEYNGKHSDLMELHIENMQPPMYLSDVMCESVIITAVAHHKWSVCICVTIGTLGELQYRGGQ